MRYSFKIVCAFPGMNEYIKALKGGVFSGNGFKREYQAIAEMYIIQQLRGVRIEKPVRLNYRFYEPNKKRDLDNVAGFTHKVVQDALVACKVLKNDGWRNIVGFSDEFYVA